MDFYGKVNEELWGQPPNFWWPEDRAWCVASDIDSYDTFVAGSQSCIEAVLGSPDIEVLPIGLTDVLDF